MAASLSTAGPGRTFRASASCSSPWPGAETEGAAVPPRSPCGASLAPRQAAAVAASTRSSGRTGNRASRFFTLVMTGAPQISYKESRRAGSASAGQRRARDSAPHVAGQDNAGRPSGRAGGPTSPILAGACPPPWPDDDGGGGRAPARPPPRRRRRVERSGRPSSARVGRAHREERVPGSAAGGETRARTGRERRCAVQRGPAVSLCPRAAHSPPGGVAVTPPVDRGRGDLPRRGGRTPGRVAQRRWRPRLASARGAPPADGRALRDDDGAVLHGVRVCGARMLPRARGWSVRHRGGRRAQPLACGSAREDGPPTTDVDTEVGASHRS